MNVFLIHFYILIGIYILGFITVFTRLLITGRKYELKKILPHYKRSATIDSLLWPYYVARYGFEGLWSEIK